MSRRDKLITGQCAATGFASGQCAATGFASGMEQSKQSKGMSTHARIVGAWSRAMLRRDKLIIYRRVCGRRFCVRDGTVKEKKKHKYTCPHCGGLVVSNVTTGLIDHRTVCGNRFYVTAGKVKDQKKNVQKTLGKK